MYSGHYSFRLAYVVEARAYNFNPRVFTNPSQIIRKIIFGDPDKVKLSLAKSTGKNINTSYIERTNANWRLWDSHLTRKSLTFAKSLMLLDAKFDLNVVSYNFIKPRSTLCWRVDKQSGKNYYISTTKY